MARTTVRLARRPVLLQQRISGHQHAGRAEAALQSVLLIKPFLDRIELAVLLQPLHGHDLAPVGHHGEGGASIHRLAVKQHGARRPQLVVCHKPMSCRVSR